MSEHRGTIAASIAYIEEHLFDDLGLEEIAAAAGLSPYHFHRTFQALAGEPVGEYLRNRRLEAAACALERSDCRIIDIAVDCGFGSQAAFSRSFAKAFGWPPGLFRALKPSRRHYRRIDCLGGERGGFPPAPPRFELLEEQEVFGIGLEVRMDGYSGSRVILGLWKEFCSRWSRDMPAAERLMGLGTYRLGGAIMDGESFEYFACAPLPPGRGIPEGYSTRAIPGGSYAVFEYDGPPRRMRDAFDHIFGEWFPQAPYRLREGPEGSIGFECYRPADMLGTLNRTMSIYVPVEPHEQHAQGVER